MKLLAVVGAVTWLATGNPGFLKIKGEGGKLTGSLSEQDGLVVGTLDVGLADFTTGLSLRDEHMRDRYLDVGKYPKATLTLEPTKLAPGAVPVKGLLTVKGETKPAAGSCDVSPSGGGYHADCMLKVRLTDYPSIGVPSYLGVTVAETVDVAVSLTAK